MVYVLRSRKDSLGFAMKGLAQHIAQKAATSHTPGTLCAIFENSKYYFYLRENN
jgi:hypothetical protein